MDRKFYDLHLSLPIEEHGIVLEREDGEGIAWQTLTNVPHLVVHHSPTGYEWGYGGSGPADLALNIVELALRKLGHGGPRMSCYAGQCFELAWTLHQQFKWRFIASAAREGDVIPWDEVVRWIEKEKARCRNE